MCKVLRKNLYCIFLFLLICLFLISNGNTISKTYQNDLEILNNSDSDQKFQTALDSLRYLHGFPGATAAYVFQDGRSVSVATGMADMEDEVPMTGRSRMLAASIGKTFVGATSVELAREGVVDLDAPVSVWLGNHNWFSRLPNHDMITLRQLLNHSSGLPDHVLMQNFSTAFSYKLHEEQNPFPPEALIQFVLDQPPLFEAGNGWSYTDTGYILAGLVIEAATGRLFYDEVKERFLNPLGLSHTSPSDRRDLFGLAAGYTTTGVDFDLPGKTLTPDGSMTWHPGIEWTGGGWVSTSSDLAWWGAALFGGKALPESSMEELLKAVSVSPETPEIQYGAGVGIRGSGPFGPVYGHGGWIPGYCSSLRYYPDHGVAIAFQVNTDKGIVDADRPVMQEIELFLANVVIAQ